MKRRTLPIRRLLLLTVLSLTLAAASPAVAAPGQSWVFGRSYYSHFPTTSVTIGRQQSTGPRFTPPQGAYANAGLRQMNTQISIPRMGTDRTILWESWIQTGEQW